MSLFSFHFLVFLGVLLLAYERSRSKGYRRGLLTLANVGFLLSLMPHGRSLAALAAFLLIGFAMLCLVRARPSPVWPPVFIAAAVCALIYLKRYDFLQVILPGGLVQHALELVGISYMTFKLIHMLVDQHQGQLPRFTFLSYLNYQIGFFSLVAGPIQRYGEFHAFWENIEGGYGAQHQGMRNWNRILTGMIKLGVLAFAAKYAYQYSRDELVRATLPSEAAISFLVSFYMFPLYVYSNFSGYCDIVIGAAGLLGMKHSENFDRPYLARNLVDFWNRWHITLTRWIRDYVFMAPYKWVAERWSAHATQAGYVLAGVALFLAGVWHGSTSNFAVFGLLHGAGVAATMIYGDVLARVAGRAGVKRYMSNAWIRRASVCVTLHYVCFTFLFFTPGLDATANVLRMLYTKVLA
jgi:D-alanyl-lipoteichoic acid acyltransferase DltB (MBOAT superfamily)